MSYNCQELNSILLNQLNNICKLLNLNYYEKGGFLFIINSENGKSGLLENKGDTTYSFIIEKDEEKLTVEFNQSYITIKKDNRSIYMDSTNLSFTKNGDKERLYLDLLYQQEMEFNKEINGISSNLKVSLNNNQYKKMIKENRTKDSTGITNEKIEIEEDPYTIANHIIHRYDLKEKMTGGVIYKEEIYLPINDFIEDELVNNPIVIKTVSDMENTIPGIIDYNKDMFPFLKYVQIYKTK